MPSFSNLPIPKLLSAARDLYTNARDDAEAFAVLSAEPFTFTAADFDAGLALVAAVEDAETAEAREDLEAQRATRLADARADAAEKTYARHRGQLRRHYRPGSAEYGALKLRGEAPDARDALLADARRLYDALAADPTPLDGVRGLDAAVVADARALVQAAIEAETRQTKEDGDVDRASERRTAAVEALRKHAGITAADAKVALADHPQLRERLGLLERS